ncbi:MAG: hypothetical protein WAL37_16430 [Xanthobacteraceae bacterium]
MTNQTTTTTPAVRGRPFAKGKGGRRPGSKNPTNPTVINNLQLLNASYRFIERAP